MAHTHKHSLWPTDLLTVFSFCSCYKKRARLVWPDGSRVGWEAELFRVYPTPHKGLHTHRTSIRWAHMLMHAHTRYYTSAFSTYTTVCVLKSFSEMFVKFLEVESTPARPAPKLPVYDIKPLSAPPPGRSTASTPASGIMSHKKIGMHNILVPVDFFFFYWYWPILAFIFLMYRYQPIGQLNVHDNFPYFYIYFKLT